MMTAKGLWLLLLSVIISVSEERRPTMANTFLQVRVDEKDKEKASAILEDLGTNLSGAVNMMIKQIIITESIPFDIKKNPTETPRSASAAFMDTPRGETDDPVIEGIREEYEWGK